MLRFILLCLVLINTFLFSEQLPFVIIIPSYNNSLYVEANLNSCLNQKYDNYRIIYINDVSSDDTLSKVNQTLKQKDACFRVELVNNSRRKYALENIYDTISNLVADDEIVVLVDGDDKLANADVLSYLNDVYQSDKIFLTYGQYAVETAGKFTVGNCAPVLHKYVVRNAYRKLSPLCFHFSHLRTFYSWLFKKIKKNSLLSMDGTFFRSAWDLALMYPMLEMSGGRFKFIDKILYLYNDNNPISDHRIRRREQYNLSNYIRRQKPYQALTNSELPDFLF